MIKAALNENKSENNSKKLSLLDLIKECNDKIVKEKEILYSFNFSTCEPLLIADKKTNEKFLSRKREETKVENEASSEKPRHKFNLNQHHSKILNIIRRKEVKLILKNQNIF